MNKSELRIASRWIPKGSSAVRIKGVDAVVYVSQAAGRWYGVAYAGSAGKPAWNYRFRSQERLAEYITDWGARLRECAKRKAEAKAKRAAFKHSLKVGDVLKSSWGYDQTNIDYYEITKVIGKYVEAREIGCESVETGWLQGKSIPVPGKFVGPAKRYLVQEGNRIKVRSFAYAYPIQPREIAPGVKVFDADYWTAYA